MTYSHPRAMLSSDRNINIPAVLWELDFALNTPIFITGSTVHLNLSTSAFITMGQVSDQEWWVLQPSFRLSSSEWEQFTDLCFNLINFCRTSTSWMWSTAVHARYPMIIAVNRNMPQFFAFITLLLTLFLQYKQILGPRAAF